MFNKVKFIIARKEFIRKPIKAVGYIKAFKLYKEYLKDIKEYNSLAQISGLNPVDTSRIFPILNEKGSSQTTNSHYFYQPLWLFRKLLEVNPNHHIDIGSQINMLGYISQFVKLTYVDIRDPKIVLNENYKFLQDSVLDLNFEDESIHSISSLHVIEHIGLGRYGDPVDPTGHIKALNEISRVCASGANFYFSTPCGMERVDFNAHRVFDPQTIIDLLPDFELISLAGINAHDVYQSSISIEELRDCAFGCGFFHFKKL